MNFKKLALGAAIAASMVAGSLAVAAPAGAVSIAGKQLSFGGDARLDNLGNGLDDSAGGQIRFNFFAFDNTTSGTANVGNSSDLIFGSGPLTLQDLLLNQTSATTWTLAPGSVTNFITGLATDSPSAFDLTTFNLSKVGTSSFEATIAGIFNPPGLDGNGTLTTQKGVLLFNGTTFSADITAVPTPALLPALLGMGAAAIRKRKGEAAEGEADAEAVEANA